MKLFLARVRKTNIKFHENAFCGARVFLSGQAVGWTDRLDEAVASRNLANAPKNPSPYYLRCHISCSVPSNGAAVVRFPMQTNSILIQRMSVTYLLMHIAQFTPRAFSNHALHTLFPIFVNALQTLFPIFATWRKTHYHLHIANPPTTPLSQLPWNKTWGSPSLSVNCAILFSPSSCDFMFS